MMSKFNDLLHLRFNKQKDAKEKMTALVEKSSKGELSSFSGVFRIAQLNEKEKEDLQTILRNYSSSETEDVEADLKALMAITSEVKAITNQAVILHGERIKRAQEILKRYQEGAFTAWLFTTYGNRQTPYNFLQYYEFYTLLPQVLHSKLDQMPRQAVYSLASRAGDFEKKKLIVESYQGQPKDELLRLIRVEFPLAEDDKRLPHFASSALTHLKKVKEFLRHKTCRLTEEEKEQIKRLTHQIDALLEKL